MADINFKNWLLSEMPIGKFEKIGQWGSNDKARGYDKKSLGILGSERGIEKIKKQWKKTSETIDMYFLRSPSGWKHTEVGEVDRNWVAENLKLETDFSDENISVIFTNNKGDQKIPMTGWILAHRFGHAVKNTSDFKHFQYELHEFMSKTLKQMYNKRVSFSYYKGEYPQINFDSHEIMRIFAQSIGTMKSARNQKISRVHEFSYELLAQFIIEGKITFNQNLAKTLTTKMRYGNLQVHGQLTSDQEEVAETEEYIRETIAPTLDYYCDSMMTSFVGRIFVM